MSRILALDYGSARCGCAVSDPSGTLATPLAAIDGPATVQGLDAVRRLIDLHAVDEVVVGLPVSLSGGEGAQALEARQYADQLQTALEVPVVSYDERFTTRLARQTPGTSDEDSRAAAHLLTSYLDARRT